jgi:hypothetical protein
MGMRGRHATPFVSLWRAAIPKPKHRCRVCKRMFDHRRRDAIYCSNACKMVRYRERREKSALRNANMAKTKRK